MKRLFFLMVALLGALPATAQQAPSDGGRTHVVRPGDTLWALAREYLADPFRWREIFGINQDVVADPHWIYPAERLRIPGAPVQAPPVAVAPTDGYVPPASSAAPSRTVFFPVSEGARSAELVTAADAQEVSVVTRGDFYRAGRLVPDSEVRSVGRLVEIAEASVIGFRLNRQIHPHTRVYMKLEQVGPGQLRVGDELHLWRPGREVSRYGRIYEPTGSARLVALDGEVATVEIERVYDAIELGDLALPVEQFPVGGGVIPRPASGLQGRIVAFASPQAVHAVEDVAFLDLGEAAGVAEGDEFEVVLPPRRTEYGIRPEMQVARLQVVRVSGRTSAARVVQLQQPALEAGQVVRLVGKMP